MSAAGRPPSIEVVARVNGHACREVVSPRRRLSDFLRGRLRLTGTHVGCEHGVCGACTVLLDGEPVRSCLLLAVQVDGREVTTIEGLAPDAEHLHPVQQAFREEHGLQCGFCTPGIVLTGSARLAADQQPGDEEIREWLAGHLCRCTGYVNVVRSVRRAGALLASRGPAEPPSPRVPGPPLDSEPPRDAQSPRALDP